MAKLTLRRKKHKKSRSLQRKSLGKSRRLQRKSRRLDKSRRLQRKSRRLDKSLGLQRKSRIQRGGRILTRLELYTALMLELLNEVYSRHGLPDDSQLIKYINGFFGNPRNFIKCIKARMVQENNDDKSLGEFITQITSPSRQSKYNDSTFALTNFKLLQQQQKWIDFVTSLQRTIDNIFKSDIELAADVVGRYYDLTNLKHIEYLRNYIDTLKEGDELGRNALHNALDRMIKSQKPIPSHFLRDIIAQVEGDYPTAAAEINKPKLKPINEPDKVRIFPSFLSDSATLYVTLPPDIPNLSGRIIANSDVDGSAKDEPGGLKQTHAHWFEYTSSANLSPGEYILVLESEQYRSDPLIITVDATHKPVNKPKLTANKNTLKRGESVNITPLFECDSATLYVTTPAEKTMIANSDVDGSAKDEQGGLKQRHKNQFTYFNLPAGEYTFQLIEYPNIQHQSDPLKITVSEAT